MNLKTTLFSAILTGASFVSCAASGSVLGPSIADLSRTHAELQILVET